MRTRVGFKPQGERKIPYREYFGEYLVITKIQGGSFAGRYIGISEEGDMIFNPHESSDYSGDRFKKIIRETNKSINPGLIGEVEITSEKSLEGYCRYINLNEIREEQRREKDALETSRKLLNNHLSIENGLK